ncbi:helix-turn-helix domain-containing protein [Actinopolymorpha singaporensis]|uniref:Helix-turn-helix domain-containing protein n=1 Tax=Actinopolymorpha singaporensis TaxID=117157 RepID=A0A1H1WM26_9ACTN|nr:helix-turn-helix domain-containing protein [Actinopolymorpha singaporensis]SDS98115.1 Helix-turn-helix domain-containing protein [Actinopolymorpha singaporensis]
MISSVRSPGATPQHPRPRARRGAAAGSGIDVPVDEHIGLACWSGLSSVMECAHRHDDIEVNLAEGGALTYLFGGVPVEIAPGTAAAFWAAVPHQLVRAPAHTRVHWITIPLDRFLRWGLTDGLVGRLLQGQPLVAATSAGTLDASGFERWSADLSTGDPELRDIALLEIQAWIRRLARGATPVEAVADAEAASGGETAVERAATMARFIAERFREPLTVADIAAAVHVHPHHAMGVFRNVVGTTLGAYLTQCRVAEAQRLLLTTGAGMAEIAHAAGFGSQSRFYSCFTAACGEPPGAYRRRHEEARQPSSEAPRDASASSVSRNTVHSSMGTAPRDR